MKNPYFLAKSLYILSKENEKDLVVSSFLTYIKKRHLYKVLPKVIFHLKNILDKENKKNKLQVFSAFDLDIKKEEKIKSIVGIKTDERIKETVNKDLLGGIFIKHKNRIYDFSVKNRIDNLKESLINN